MEGLHRTSIRDFLSHPPEQVADMLSTCEHLLLNRASRMKSARELLHDNDHAIASRGSALFQRSDGRPVECRLL